MTEREKQILDIIKKLRNSTPISELERCAKNCNMSLDDYIDHEEASEIASLFETELNKFAYEQGLYSYDKEKIKKAIDRYLSNKQKL